MNRVKRGLMLLRCATAVLLIQVGKLGIGYDFLAIAKKYRALCRRFLLSFT